MIEESVLFILNCVYVQEHEASVQSFHLLKHHAKQTNEAWRISINGLSKGFAR